MLCKDSDLFFYVYHCVGQFKRDTNVLFLIEIVCWCPWSIYQWRVSRQGTAEWDNTKTGNKISGYRKCLFVTNGHPAIKQLKLQPCRFQAVYQQQRDKDARIQFWHWFRRFAHEWACVQCWGCVLMEYPVPYPETIEFIIHILLHTILI